MSFNFTVEQFKLGSGTGTPSLQFYKRGFDIGGSGSSPSWQDIVLSGNGSLTLTNAKADGLNYLKLFGGTEQRNLPEGYTQLEYLQSDGTQEIRLPFLRISEHTYKAEIDWEPVSYANSAGIFSFGADYLGYQISTYTSGGNGIGFSSSNYIISSGRTQMTATQSSDGLTTTLTDGSGSACARFRVARCCWIARMRVMSH